VNIGLSIVIFTASVFQCMAENSFFLRTILHTKLIFFLRLLVVLNTSTRSQSFTMFRLKLIFSVFLWLRSRVVRIVRGVRGVCHTPVGSIISAYANYKPDANYQIVFYANKLCFRRLYDTLIPIRTAAVHEAMCATPGVVWAAPHASRGACPRPQTQTEPTFCRGDSTCNLGVAANTGSCGCRCQIALLYAAHRLARKR
jgi:hypothetical protein